MRVVALLTLAGLAVAGCSSQNPVRPDAGTAAVQANTTVPPSGGASPTVTTAGKPGYEPAYYGGSTVTINAIEVPQNTGPLTHASADFYQVAYPPTQALWPSNPQCNPCDHDQNGIQFTDFHDHVLDSIPSDPGHGNFTPLWHVWVIIPADMSLAGQTAYAARLPMKSEAAIDAAITAGIATKIDTGFYFLCAVVSPNAAH